MDRFHETNLSSKLLTSSESMPFAAPQPQDSSSTRLTPPHSLEGEESVIGGILVHAPQPRCAGARRGAARAAARGARDPSRHRRAGSVRVAAAGHPGITDEPGGRRLRARRRVGDRGARCREPGASSASEPRRGQPDHGRRVGARGEPMKWLALSVRIVLAALAVVFLAVVVVTPLDVGPQLLLGGAAFALALVVRNRNFASTGPLLTMFSIVASSRYIWWRVSSTIDFDSTTDRILGLSLLGAELYAFAVLLLGAFQTLYVLQRKPAPLPADRAAWPTVDVFIPTYNEPLEVVRPTVLAALRIDWP